MKVFFDTSALIKRYIEEPGSEDVVDLCRQADSLIISIICLPEMISTLNRLIREKNLTKNNYHQIKKSIITELEDMEVSSIVPEVLRYTIHSLEKNPLRAMDAIHIGCALTVKPDLFISADNRQIAAAQKEGLAVRQV